MNTLFPLITVENLKVFRGRVEVLDLSYFTLHQSEIVALIGPNGSGKSTLLLTLNGLIKPTIGKIIFKGRPLESRKILLDSRRRMAMVFQEPLLFDTTVFNNVAAGLKIRGIDGGKIRRTVMEGLERFNIVHLADRSARKLSGGEAQRTSLARALATDPEVIFLDEPFSALDPPTRQSITADLERIIREKGISAVLVTHDESEALRLSDRIMVMNNGRLVQTGDPREIMNRPVNRFVAEFVGMESIFPGQVLHQSKGRVVLSVTGGVIEAEGNFSEGEKVLCGIRPEKVKILKGTSETGTDVPNYRPARITALAANGPFLKLALDCGFLLSAYVTWEWVAEDKLKAGDPVQVSFHPADIHLMPGEEKTP